jgi:hypothetical protein
MVEQEKGPAFPAKPVPIRFILVPCLFSVLGKEFPGWQKLSFSGSWYSFVILNMMIQLQRLKRAYLVFGF